MTTHRPSDNRMAKPKEKFYVVWSGREPGIYLTWEDCKGQVIGIKESRYKAFPTMEEARQAFSQGAPAREQKRKERTAGNRTTDYAIRDAYAVDAACSGNPGMMEYQGVDVQSKARLFHFGPVYGTNNIGEFLAIVHALALQKKLGTRRPVYSDSRNALLWVKAKKCKTKLPHTEKSAQVYGLIERAEKWLRSNPCNDIQLLKWHTDRWGEIPADFGRK